MRGILVILFTACFLMVTACGKSAPQCTDGDVKNLVMEIVADEFKNQMTRQAIINQAGIDPALWGNPSYNDLKQRLKSIGAEAKGSLEQNIIDSVDRQTAAISLELDGIRDNGADKKIKKCNCGANLSMLPKGLKDQAEAPSFPISYTAQYTEDDKLHVEVFGLK
jgi:hypothetical protein